MLAAVTAMARRTPLRITPPADAPVLRDWAAAMEAHLRCVWTDDACEVVPQPAGESLRVAFDFPALPYRDLIVFTLLGMGKTAVFRSITPGRCDLWREQARRAGFTLAIETRDNDTCISLAAETPPAAAGGTVDENDLQPLLGLLLGSGGKKTFIMDTVPASPLRTVAPLFGCSIEVRSSIPRERNELARRLHHLQQKQHPAGAGQQFVVTADFSGGTAVAADPVNLSLPGDELAAALFIAAKCLFPKSQLVIGNVPLETWATPTIAFIRKMGCKVSLQETGRTAFGPAGLVHIQNAGLSGRKMDCVPAVQYIPFVPSMVVTAAYAEDETILRGLADLRSDEPDGIAQIETCIRSLGARHGELPDGIVLKGGRDFDGFDIAEPMPAHVAAAFAVAGLRCIGATTVNDEQVLRRLPSFGTMLGNIAEYRD
jgi:hypothetical protein